FVCFFIVSFLLGYGSAITPSAHRAAEERLQPSIGRSIDARSSWGALHRAQTACAGNLRCAQRCSYTPGELRPASSDTTNITTASMARSHPMSADRPATPPRPSNAATTAMMKNVNDQLSMALSFLHRSGSKLRAAAVASSRAHFHGAFAGIAVDVCRNYTPS